MHACLFSFSPSDTDSDFSKANHTAYVDSSCASYRGEEKSGLTQTVSYWSQYRDISFLYVRQSSGLFWVAHPELA